MSVENMFSDLSRVIEQMGKDKGINREVIVEAVVEGMLVAARKKYGTYRDIEASYNEESGEVELFEFKEVVTDEEFVDELIEIIYEDALKLDPEAQLKDSIGIRLDSSDLGRIAAQTAKQIIIQKVRDAEREIIFAEFDERKGDVVSGIARRVERGAIVVDMGKTEAFIPMREQIPGEAYKPGDRIQGYLIDVRQSTRGPQIIMSRASEQYLMKLFEQEVPEIYDGIVQIVVAAREPGQRAKIAVYSKDPSVDPVGACVGMKGSRVQNVVQELRGEKIDIVVWDEDVTKFVCNALAPAEISKVFMDETNKEMEVVVPDSQLSLAIGRRGQNVRLAAKLTGWKLDILSDSDSSTKTAESIFNLMLIPGMSETMAQNLFQSGFGTFQTVAEAEADQIMTIPGYGEEAQAVTLIDAAKELVEKYEEEGIEIPVLKVEEKIEVATGSAKSQAEDRLKAEMASLSIGADDSVDTTVEVANEVVVDAVSEDGNESSDEAVKES